MELCTLVQEPHSTCLNMKPSCLNRSYIMLKKRQLSEGGTRRSTMPPGNKSYLDLSNVGHLLTLTEYPMSIPKLVDDLDSFAAYKSFTFMSRDL